MNLKSYYIKKRFNPQSDDPYYVACGQLSKAEAKRKGKAIYGHNEMLEYVTAEEYNRAIERLKANGFTVRDA